MKPDIRGDIESRDDGSESAIELPGTALDHAAVGRWRKWIYVYFRRPSMADRFYRRSCRMDVWSPNTTRAVWSLAALGAVGDVVTTRAGIALGAAEANPAAEAAVHGAGLGELAITKAMILLAVAVAWAWAGEIDAPRDVIPATIGILWVAVSLWNLTVIGRVL